MLYTPRKDFNGIDEVVDYVREYACIWSDELDTFFDTEVVVSTIQLCRDFPIDEVVENIYELPRVSLDGGPFKDLNHLTSKECERVLSKLENSSDDMILDCWEEYEMKKESEIEKRNQIKIFLSQYQRDLSI